MHERDLDNVLRDSNDGRLSESFDNEFSESGDDELYEQAYMKCDGNCGRCRFNETKYCPYG